MRRVIGLAALMLLAATAAGHAVCTVSASGVAFGTYDTTSSSTTNVTGTVTVTCPALTGGYSFTIALSTGGGTYAQRTMANGTPTLDYQLFTDSGRTNTWSNGTGVAQDSGSFPAAGGTTVFTVYGGMRAHLGPSAGGYTDAITASVTGASTGNPSVTFAVTAVVSPGCLISVNALSFGTYIGVALSATTTLTVTCTNTTPYEVNLDNGLNFLNVGSNWSNRMTGPNATLLNYELYQDASHATPWWFTAGKGEGVKGTGSGTAQTLTVYGLIFAGQYVSPGSYTDTVVAKVTY